MDQKKIGNFILSLRKEKNMTQLELATRLGVTDRAISKWENGRGLPDISLIKPLCDELSISINELLCGERIEENKAVEKSEETIINTLDYSRKNIKTTKKIFFSILAAVIALCLSFTVLFFVDVKMMSEGRPVFFSTWGLDYAPPIDLYEKNIEIAIKKHFIEISDLRELKHEGQKTFVAMRTFLIDEVEEKTKYIVYAWVLEETYYEENGIVIQDSGASTPYKLTVIRNGNIYSVMGHEHPRDGSYYKPDMRMLFPFSVRNNMYAVHRDGTIEKLILEIQEQVELYFHK